MKTLNELLTEKATVLPKYLVVKVDQMGYHGINEGQEVYETDAKGIRKMELNEANELKAVEDYVVKHDSANNRVFVLLNTNKNPYIGKGPIEVEVASGDTANRAMLELFGEFSKGRHSFGVTVFATDILADIEDPVEEG